MVARIEAALGAAEAGSTVEIWADNWDIVRAFGSVLTQWRTAPAGLSGIYYVGLDYAAVRVGLRLAGFKLTPALWEGVRVMEAEAKASLNGAL